MRLMTTNTPFPYDPTRAAFAVSAIGAATLIGAWIFQYGFGYVPCALCWMEREPYYLTIPLALIAGIAGARGVSRKFVLVTLTVCLAAFLYNGGLSFYHAGAEYGLWPGPESCGGGMALPSSVEELQARLSAGEHPPRCDEAAWTLFGISLAGYNFLISLLLSALSAAPVAHYLQTRKEKA